MQPIQVRGNFQHVGERRSPTLRRRYERPWVCTNVVDCVADIHLVLVFRSKLIGQEACDSLLDAEFSSANLAAQYGVPDSIPVTPERLGNRQFTSVIGAAAEQGDHIPGERTNHQMASLGECRLIEM